jgi:hypothetical protein
VDITARPWTTAGFAFTLVAASAIVAPVAAARLDVPATAVGPNASLFLQDQAIAESIGWDGVGQPLAHLFSELTTLFN